MKDKFCPACGNRACSPLGNSDFLIIGDAPTDLDMIKGHPFSNHPKYMTHGKILRKEMQRVGLSLNEHRLITMWLHEPNKNENCFQAGIDNVMSEIVGKKAVLLVGADVVNAFTDFKVSDVSGLEVDSAVLNVPHVMAMVNPSIALARAYGEVRFAVEQWAELLERINE